MQPHN
jgi:hypothetical protein